MKDLNNERNQLLCMMLEQKITLAEAGLIFLVNPTTSPSAETIAIISPLLSKLSA